MNGWQTRLRAAVLAAAVACAIGGGVAYAATPTTPTMRDVFVTPRASLATTPTVTVQWSASTDASGHPVVYDIYRDVIPVTGATIISRGLTPVATGLTGTSAIINAASAETTQSYVWYYAVQARDSLNIKSGVSYNMSPNVHSNRVDPNQISCPRCHQVHGAYRVPYQTKEACYFCHGSTGAAFATGAKSTYNTEASFFDTGTVTAGSKHRNATMTSTRQECTACHTPHRSPFFYDAAGVYQASLSYRRMLRIEYPTNTYTYYSRNDSPQGNAFCFGCHGANSGPIAIVGGANAYADSGGDHNSAGYATAAHGPATVLTNTTEPNPAIQCLACHNKHASRADKLVDYRSQNTTASQTGGADVCFACHSNTTTDTRLVGTKPYAWNGRDVRAQFTDTATYKSRHPYRTVAGSYVTETSTVLAHTTQAEFNTYTLVNATTTNTAGGEIVLSQYTGTIVNPIVFGRRGGGPDFDEFTAGSGVWNDLYNPTNATWNTATGSSAFVVNNRVYVTRGNNSTAQDYYDIATNTWTGGQTLPAGISTGGDTALNTRSDSTCAYYTRAGGQAAIMWWNYTGTETGSFNFQVGGNATSLGIGSAIAFAPNANRLFVINNNNTAGDGRLYWRASPGRATTNVNFTQGAQVVQAASGRHARMTYFVRGGVEYLMIIGYDASNQRDTIIVSNLAGTPTVTELGIYPFGNNDLGDGCDLEWDGGDYIYAIRGGNQTGFARIRISDTPTIPTSWTAWQSLANPPWGANWAAGSSIAPAAYNTTGLLYRTSGTATTPDITPAGSVHRWGTLTWTESEPANTGLRVTVEGYNGSAWQTLVSGANAGPVDLTAYSTAAYPKLRLRAELSSADGINTPWLYDWTLTGLYDRLVTPSGSLTCANCHNVHYVRKGGTEVWDMARANDPDNTKLASPSSPSDFCLRCHDGTPPASSVNATTIVPYAVAFSDQTAPFFPGWNKAAPGVDWATSGHKNSTVPRMTPECSSCHDPHASQNQRLTALTAYYTGTSPPSAHINQRRNNTSAYAEEALCYACHTSSRTPNCAASGCHTAQVDAINVQTPFTMTYRHPVERAGRHSDTETASQLGSANRHAECVDCHDPHALRRGLHTTGSSLAGEAIRGATGVKPTAWPANWTVVPAGNWRPERLDGQGTDYEAYLCFKCHSSYSGQPFTVTGSSGATYTSTDQALEFNPSNFSYHNVLGQSTGMQSTFTFTDTGGTQRTVTWAVPTRSFFVSGSSWTTNSMMTCTECHTNSTASAKGPHGSSAQWLLDPAYPTDWKTAWLQNTTNGMSSATVICAKCHDLNGPNSTNTWSNNVHSAGDHQGSNRGVCVKCHIKIPHGWKRPRLLAYVDADGIYTVPATTGLTRIGLSNITLNNGAANWPKNNCTTNCGGHNTAITPYWP